MLEVFALWEEEEGGGGRGVNEVEEEEMCVWSHIRVRR